MQDLEYTQIFHSLDDKKDSDERKVQIKFVKCECSFFIGCHWSLKGYMSEQPVGINVDLESQFKCVQSWTDRALEFLYKIRDKCCFVVLLLQGLLISYCIVFAFTNFSRLMLHNFLAVSQCEEQLFWDSIVLHLDDMGWPAFKMDTDFVILSFQWIPMIVCRFGSIID